MLIKKNHIFLILVIQSVFYHTNLYSNDFNPVILGTSNGHSLNDTVVLNFNSNCLFKISNSENFISFEWRLEVLKDDLTDAYIYFTANSNEFQFQIGDLPGKMGEYRWKKKSFSSDIPYKVTPDYIVAKVIFTGIDHSEKTYKVEKEVFLNLLPEDPTFQVIDFYKAETAYQVKMKYSAKRADYFYFGMWLPYDGQSRTGTYGIISSEDSTIIENCVGDQMFYIMPMNKYGWISSDLIYVDSLISKLTSIPLIESKSEIIVYPNPIENVLNIKSQSESVIGSDILFFDLNGKALFTCKVNQMYDQIDVSTLPSGFYILVIRKNSKILKKEKVIKLHTKH